MADFHEYCVFNSDFAQGNPAAVMEVTELPNFCAHLLFPTDCRTRVYLKHIESNHYQIRWMNDSASITRCGHGTVAATAFLAEKTGMKNFYFSSETETLAVFAAPPLYQLEFRTVFLVKADENHSLFVPKRMMKSAGEKPYYIAELQDAKAVSEFSVNPSVEMFIGKGALIVTARCQQPFADIVFRYLAPHYDQFEDQATGSAAGVLLPFWRGLLHEKRMFKKGLRCYQASQGGGYYRIFQGNKDHVLVEGHVKKL